MSSQPPIQTTFSPSKSKLLREMPAAPEIQEEEDDEGLVDDMKRASAEVQQQQEVLRPRPKTFATTDIISGGL